MERYLCFLTVLYINPLGYSYLILEDGASHTIDYYVNTGGYGSAQVIVDQDSQPNPGTHVDILENGRASEIHLWGNSSMNLSGGRTDVVYLRDNSSLVINDNTASTDITAYAQSTINIKGGLIWSVDAGGSSTVIIENQPQLVYVNATNQDSIIHVYGGTSAPYRNVSLSASDGKIVLYGDFDWYGQITSEATIGGWADGTLVSGDQIHWNYTVSHGGVLEFAPIPEPASLLLLSIGGLLIRKRK